MNNQDQPHSALQKLVGRTIKNIEVDSYWVADFTEEDGHYEEIASIIITLDDRTTLRVVGDLQDYEIPVIDYFITFDGDLLYLESGEKEMETT